ncbi:hypothetical protein BHM03_00020218 [Ensete ventricosum]|nr:hypothetical protein BHM03_00020218 [Ensete ventricosum]
MVSHTSMDSSKNMTVINFARSRAQSFVSIGFSCTISEIQNTGIPNVLAHGKSYEHGSVKKRDGHKLYVKSHAESSFDRFFVYRLENLKYWSFPTYWPKGSRTNTISWKNATVINFEQSHE